MTEQKAFIDDYAELQNVYLEVSQCCKSSAENKLLEITFGLYLGEIASYSQSDILLCHRKLNNVYSAYYTIYLRNITKCNQANFDKLRDVVCYLLDKYGPPYSDSKKYYLSIDDYLCDSKYE